jgi:hypothetical protein
MAVYTISPDLLRNIEKDEGVYFTDILFIFTQRTNPFKVSKDKNGDVINSYLAIERNGETIKTWLDLMSFKPSPFELIDVDLSHIDCEETRFMKICKETKSQNKLILYTHQNLKEHFCEKDIVIFENVAIQVLDRDQARQELTVVADSGDTYINSQVAKQNSQINRSRNKNS